MTDKSATLADSQVITNQYYLKGLDCPDCARAVEESVKDLPLVHEAKLIFSLGKLEVSHSTDEKKIIKIIESHGCRVEQVGGWGNNNFVGQVANPGSSSSYPAGDRDRGKHFIATLGEGGIADAVISGTALLVAVMLWLLNYPAGLVIAAYMVAIVIGGWATFRQGITNLGAFRFDMNVLMTVAVIGAVLIGEWLEGAIIAFLFSLSNTLENFSMEKTRQSIKELMSLAPAVATIKVPQAPEAAGEAAKCAGGSCCSGHEIAETERTVPVAQITVGDVVTVRPGERVAMDGEVTFGSSWVNEAPITGESMLKEKGLGDLVYAGSVNEGGYLEVKVTKLAKDNMVAKIIELVEKALAEKPPVQKFIDRFAGYYTPLVLLIALGMVTIPPLAFSQEFTPWLYRALALLLIACPCALVISTPVALVTAMGKGAKEGILIKGGLYLEQMARVKAIAFDKTGTLTKGKPRVSKIKSFGLTDKQLMEVAASLEKMSEHPLAKSLCRYAHGLGFAGNLPVNSFQVLPGKGIKGVLELKDKPKETWVIGSLPFLAQEGLEISGEAGLILEEWRQTGEIIVGLGVVTGEDKDTNRQEPDVRGKLRGLISFQDELRPEAKSALQDLSKLGISTFMLTGDNTQVANQVAREVGISQVKSRLLPAEKLAFIEEIEQSTGQVAMIGDGINDAPALAKASVGVAMGVAGTDTALETADVALMSDDLSKLPLLVTLSRKTLQIIGQNIVIALGLKLLAILLIFPGWLTLWMAVVADMGTTLLVTLNGLRLLKHGGK